jgi:hypothetical protein
VACDRRRLLARADRLLSQRVSRRPPPSLLGNFSGVHVVVVVAVKVNVNADDATATTTRT